MVDMETWLYKKVVFAGTFDHLHEGHKYLLRTAMKLGEYVGIGLTTDKLHENKKGREKIQDFEERKQALIDFFKEENATERYEFFPIETKEGGADKMEDLEALIISDEISVVNNAFEINELRAQNGLTRFHILIIPRVRTDDGRPLSSSRIRDGESFQGAKLVQ
ncbi:MAG: pantetheine-phosphate adenylyltransferase [Candidatus Thorarchaeota archaeon]|nr:pantetheine-phosphate adenylyltransferase [Candidatus Thorarchaeota archaeon]